MNQSQSLENTNYRSEIDGIRAIAVMSVVIYHYFPSLLPGGFIGVDIFFVISGYLISNIILNSMRKNRFSLSEFYSRRIRRIFPALILVLTACAVFGWYALAPGDYENLGIHIAGGSGFVSNLLLWSELGYFDESSKLKPLLHLWSLGVEEQFYIFWPMLLLIATKSRWNPLITIATICLASFGLNLLTLNTDASGAFYNPLTRIWELLVGALLAQLSQEDSSRDMIGRIQASWFADFLSILGVLLIFFGLFSINSTSTYPSPWTLAPTLGTACLITAGPTAVTNRYILSRRALVYIGLISYPLYLWHWPLIAFARIMSPEEPSLELRGVLAMSALFLAWITYRFVELPIRSIMTKNTTKSIALAMAFIGMAGSAIFLADGIPSRFSQDVEKFINFQYEFSQDARAPECWITFGAKPDAFHSDCTDVTQSKRSVVLWGDSHAARLYPGIRNSFTPRMALSQYTRNSCAPLLGLQPGGCLEGNDYVLSVIKKQRPEAVVMFAHWTVHFAKDQEVFFSSLKKTLTELRSAGVEQVVVVGPAPKWNTRLPNNIAQLMRTEQYDRVPKRTNFGKDPSVEELDRIFRRRLSSIEGVAYVSAIEKMCNDEGCLIRLGDTADSLTTWDYGHLTTKASIFLAREISKETNGLR